MPVGGKEAARISPINRRSSPQKYYNRPQEMNPDVTYQDQDPSTTHQQIPDNEQSP